MANKSVLTTFVYSFALSFLLGHDNAHSQEMGAIQRFGPNGLLYSTDRYLLSRQSYGTEDSTGYEGQFLIVKRHSGGGYETETFDYIARCRAVDGNSMIMTFRPGNNQEPLASVAVNPQKRPGPGLTNAFNLFWAACYGRLHRFN